MPSFWPRALKTLHELGAAGLLGAFACYLVLHTVTPADAPLAALAASRAGIYGVCRWLLVPSLALVLVSGLLAMLTTPAYKNAGWVWVKALSGVLVFEATLMAVGSGARKAFELTSQALGGEPLSPEIAQIVHSEGGALWLLLAIALANLLLGVWRPRFGRRTSD